MTTSWTEEQGAALKVALAEGCSFAQAAAVVNELFKTTYSRNAAIGIAHRLGLSQPPRKAPAVARKPAARKIRPPANRIPVVARQPADDPTVERTADVVPRHISIYELTEQTCHWPFGHSAPYTFCGCPTFADGPYCEPHASLSVGRGTGDERYAHRVARRST